MDLRWPVWVGLVVDDVEAARRFYRDVVGLRELRAMEGFVWFDLGDGRLFDLLRRDDDHEATARLGFQVGFEVENVETAREELITRGARPVGGIAGGPKAGSRWACFADADGNVFQLTQRLGPSSV